MRFGLPPGLSAQSEIVGLAFALVDYWKKTRCPDPCEPERAGDFPCDWESKGNAKGYP
jgi:hypothetical protein